MKDSNTSLILLSQLVSQDMHPICVHKTNTLEKAESLLLMNNYSQLPVVSGRNKIEGYISWQTIHTAQLHGATGTIVGDYYSTDYHAFPISATILDVLQEIERNDFVMLHDAQGHICAILTASDFTKQYMQLVQPFILLYEFESHLRHLLLGVFSEAELKHFISAQGTKECTRIEDLTLGQYGELLEQDNNFDRLQLPRTNRAAFLHQLGIVRDIRNKVMHFRSVGLSNEEMNILKNTVRYMRNIVKQ